MPGKSFSIPAHKSCPREWGDICANCYAGKGCYKWRSTQAAQMARFRWVVECMRTEAGRAAFVAYMIQAIGRLKSEYFRIHDSGDFFNVHYAACWLEICKALPQKKFWAPTRAWQQQGGALVIFDPLLNMLRQLASLPNVTVRPSALNFGDAAPVVAGLHAGSSAEFAAAPFECPARWQKNQCGPCRHCWESKTETVNYPQH